MNTGLHQAHLWLFRPLTQTNEQKNVYFPLHINFWSILITAQLGNLSHSYLHLKGT